MKNKIITIEEEIEVYEPHTKIFWEKLIGVSYEEWIKNYKNKINKNVPNKL